VIVGRDKSGASKLLTAQFMPIEAGALRDNELGSCELLPLFATQYRGATPEQSESCAEDSRNADAAIRTTSCR